jgi:hypothetical protein
VTVVIVGNTKHVLKTTKKIYKITFTTNVKNAETGRGGYIYGLKETSLNCRKFYQNFKYMIMSSSTQFYNSTKNIPLLQ